MNTELNKRVAAELFARFSAGDLAGVLDTMTEDATWLIPGKPASSPAAGLYDKRRIGRLFQAMLDRLESGLTMTVTGAIAEGDKVALEVRSRRADQRQRLPAGVPLPDGVSRRQDLRGQGVPGHATRTRRVVPATGVTALAKICVTSRRSASMPCSA